MTPRKVAAWCLALGVLALGSLEAQQILLVSPAIPTTADQVTIFLTVPACAYRVTNFIQDHTVFLYPDTTLPCPPLGGLNPGGVTASFIGPLAAGSYTVIVDTAGKTTDSRAFFVQQPTANLFLLEQRFAVSVTWSIPDGRSGTGQAVQVSDSSGYFWFFDNGSPELTVKILDGSAVNGHLWVFASSATDVAFTLSIVDTWQCAFPPTGSCPASQTYQSVAGSNRNFIDLTTFSWL